jgi:hypothetical protein
MSSRLIDRERLTAEVFAVLDEVFVTHHGIFLDPDTSLFQTLAGITAEQASRPVGGQCASLAAQVAHVTLYLEVLEAFLITRQGRDTDWSEIWRTVEAVSPEGWSDLAHQLEATYRRLASRLRDTDEWEDPDVIGAALAMAVHSAYHLGEIRQALCTMT